MGRRWVFAACFFAVFLFLLYQVYRIFSFFLAPLTWAALLAFIFFPAQRLVLRLVGDRPRLAASLLTAAVVLIVIVPTILLTTVVTAQSVALYERASDVIRGGELEALLAQWQASPLGTLARQTLGYVHPEPVDWPNVVLRVTNAVSRFLAQEAPAAVGNVLRFITNFFFMVVALFFFFRHGETLLAMVRELLPMDTAHKETIFARLYETLSAVVFGSLVTAAVQGTLAGIGFWLVGVPFSALLGLAAAFVSLLPFGGPVVWGAVVIGLVLGGDYRHAGILFLWGALVVSSADNVVRPLVIGGRTAIPIVVLLFAILGGLQAYGFLGVFLAPTLVAVLVAFVRIYRTEYAPTLAMQEAAAHRGADGGDERQGPNDT